MDACLTDDCDGKSPIEATDALIVKDDLHCCER